MLPCRAAIPVCEQICVSYYFRRKWFLELKDGGPVVTRVLEELFGCVVANLARAVGEPYRETVASEGKTVCGIQRTNANLHRVRRRLSLAKKKTSRRTNYSSAQA